MIRIAARTALAFVAATALASCARPSDDDAFAATAKRLMPAVVLLSMHIPPAHRADRYDEGYASGFVIASGDWGSDVLTVQHAIDNASHLEVTIANREKVRGYVVASNADLDLALLRIAHRSLPVVSLGSSAHLSSTLGKHIGLIGYPVPDEFDDENLGVSASVAAGLLSSVRRDALEVMMPIVPGESGAPIFLARSGEIIGLAESRFDDEPSIGFAIPIDDAKRFLHRNDAAHGF